MTTPPGAIIGYARTSSSDQRAGLDAQIAQETGISRASIYRALVEAA